MGVTLNKLIYNIQNLRRGGFLSDDEPYSDRQWAFIIGYVRAKLIKQYLDKRRVVSADFVQSLPCVDMEMVDVVECCPDFPSNCLIAKSKERLPEILQYNDTFAIRFVGRVDGVPFHFTTEAQAKRNVYNKYTSKFPNAFLRGGYLYVTNLPMLEKVRIDAVFNDPTDVARFSTCEGESCFSYDSPYPIPEHMISDLNVVIMDRELRLVAASQNDQVNDARDTKV